MMPISLAVCSIWVTQSTGTPDFTECNAEFGVLVAERQGRIKFV